MNSKNLLVLNCVTLLILLSQATEVRVQLNLGDVVGEETTDENGNPCFWFRGIPYAEPPVGDLRFKPPVPKRPWQDTLEATKDGPPCPQIDMFFKSYVGQENNCLTLNIYTPKRTLTDDRKLPVIFHIPGGGFISGEGGTKTYGPKRFMLMEMNVVLVSMTYRVNVIGFLSTQDAASPGNYGLLDQVEALRWVRNNIDRFGGDPTQVTIWGESAGGASVIYHMLSPLSTGLFHKAIAMSGTSLCSWALQKNPTYWAKTLGEYFKCPNKEKSDLVQCLREIGEEELTKNSGTVVNRLFYMIFGPSVDNFFLPDTPYNLIKNMKYNKVPLMTGVTKNEGGIWFKAANPLKKKLTLEEIMEMIKTTVAFFPENEKAAQLVKERYLPNLQDLSDEEVELRLSQIVTDGMFHKPFYQMVKMMTENNDDIYAYSYDFPGSFKNLEAILNFKDIGAVHASDIFLFFNNRLLGDKKLEGKFAVIKEKFQKLIMNFITSGNPNSRNEDVQWLPSKKGQINMYHVDEVSSVTTYDDTKDDLYNFWIEKVPEAYSPMSSAKDEL